MEGGFIEFHPGMKVDKDAAFKPGVYECTNSDGIEVIADNIQLDFSGVIIKGGRDKTNAAIDKVTEFKKFSYGDEQDERIRIQQLGYFGIAIIIKNRKDITVRGLTARGFNLAVLIENSERITIEGCDFSDNFHDPDCGWNEHGPFGGIYVLNSSYCVIQNNKANRVWNGLYLRHADHNVIKNNDFSYCSNNCLKMWHACSNIVENNNLSWGLRIKPGEVHARDSAGLLMESGSNDNIVRSNDLTHGGDGIFVRVLNGWHSQGNIFENNDCSYANNNAIEAWANGNTYIKNKANYSSYGFWLGGSDNTSLIDNDVAYNGTVFQNAPEAFGNCGIAVVNGSGTNFKVIGNRVHDNNGPGIAIRFKEDYPVKHWIIEDNEIYSNKTYKDYTGHGIYLKNARWLTLSNNKIFDNDGQDIFIDDNVSDVFMLNDDAEKKHFPVKACVKFPDDFVMSGQEIVFDASGSSELSTGALDYRWDFGDGELAFLPVVKKIYHAAGSYYAGVTVTNGYRSDLAGKVIYVIPKGMFLAMKEAVELENSISVENTVVKCDDDNFKYEIDSSENYGLSLWGHAQRASKWDLRFELTEGIELSRINAIAFFLKFENDADTDWEKTINSPVVKLIKNRDNYITFIPLNHTMDMLFAEKTHEKYGYKYFEIPMRPLVSAKERAWVAEINGEVKIINSIEIEIRKRYEGYTMFHLRDIVLC